MDLYELYQKVSVETIYSFILGKCGDNKQYPAPYRLDKTPSLKLYLKNGDLLWHDMTEGVGGDVLKLLHKVYSVKYKRLFDTRELLDLIYNDIKSSITLELDIHPTGALGLDRSSIGKSKEFKLSYVDNMYNGKPIFTKLDLKYWDRGFLTVKHLIKERVRSANMLLKDGKPLWHYRGDNPIYVYLYKGATKMHIKGYRPFNSDKKFKWISDIDTSNINMMFEGYDELPQNGDLLLINKSKKDYMITKYIFNYVSTSPQGEGALLIEYLELDFMLRFKEIIILFDNDTAGIFQMTKIQKALPNIKCFFYPKKLGKDTYEICDKYHNKTYVESILYSMVKAILDTNKVIRKIRYHNVKGRCGLIWIKYNIKDDRSKRLYRWRVFC